jgi:hypothetical protein
MRLRLKFGEILKFEAEILRLKFWYSLRAETK